MLNPIARKSKRERESGQVLPVFSSRSGFNRKKLGRIGVAGRHKEDQRRELPFLSKYEFARWLSSSLRHLDQQ